MRYPNLRYGNPSEMAYYCQGLQIHEIARRLRRSERSVRNWLSGRERMPWWIPELLRLQAMEQAERARQMGYAPLRRLGVVKTGQVVEFPGPGRAQRAITECTSSPTTPSRLHSR